MSILLRSLCILWIGACASTPSPATPATPVPPKDAPAPDTTGADTPEQSTSKSLELVLHASEPAIAGGQDVKLTIVATNNGPTALWTQPGITCTGSWDIAFRNPEGAIVRVDDRDAMGCPSGGTLKKQLSPGESITVPVSWDGHLRPSLGQTKIPPGGLYKIEASVRWSLQAGTPNYDGPKTFVTSASTTIEVLGPRAKPPQQGNNLAPAPPGPPSNPSVSLRSLFGRFVPPQQVVVAVGQGQVTVALSSHKEALARISRAQPLTLPDVVTVNGKNVPYHSAWERETKHGKRGPALSLWAKAQASKYGISVKALNAAVAADWTRQGRIRAAKVAKIHSDFLQQHGVSTVAVTQEFNRLREAYKQQVIADIARRHGITNPRLTSWGAAGGSLGIQGTIKGKPVLWHNGVILRQGQRPRNSRNKCLPPTARIATPYGEILLRDLAIGDTVWSLDRHGQKVATPIGDKSRVPLSAPHSMVELRLEDGRVVQVSPLHPSADKQVTMGDFRVGDAVDGSIVRRRTTIAYQASETQDILPLGDTHVYWANGVLMGSTLTP